VTCYEYANRYVDEKDDYDENFEFCDKFGNIKYNDLNQGPFLVDQINYPRV